MSKRRRLYNYKFKKSDDSYDSSEDSAPPLPSIFPGMLATSSLFGKLLNKDDDEHGKVNHIYFYDTVEQDSCLSLCKKIKSTALKLEELMLKYDLKETPQIYLHISSYGGCIFSAFGVVDTILQSKIPIVTIIEGASASAATLISVAGHERWIGEYGYMLIHELRSGNWGKMSDLEDDFDNCQELMRRIKQHYVKFSNGKCAGDKFDEILKHDIWWSAKDCLEFGLVDKIITGTPDEIGNCINVAKKHSSSSKKQRTK